MKTKQTWTLIFLIALTASSLFSKKLSLKSDISFMTQENIFEAGFISKYRVINNDQNILSINTAIYGVSNFDKTYLSNANITLYYDWLFSGFDLLNFNIGYGLITVDTINGFTSKAEYIHYRKHAKTKPSPEFQSSIQYAKPTNNADLSFLKFDIDLLIFTPFSFDSKDNLLSFNIHASYYDSDFNEPKLDIQKNGYFSVGFGSAPRKIQNEQLKYKMFMGYKISPSSAKPQFYIATSAELGDYKNYSFKL